MNKHMLVVPTIPEYTITLTEEAIEARDKALALAKTVKVVTNAEEQAAAIKAAADLKAYTSSIEKSRKAVKQPSLDIGRDIDEAARVASSNAKAETQRLELMVGKFQREENARIEAARQEQERLKREKEEAEAAAAFAETEKERKDAEEKAVTLKEEIEFQKTFEEETPVAKPEGGSVKVKYIFKVTDIRAFYAAFPHLCTIEPKTQAINYFINTPSTDHASIPGLEITEETKFTARSTTTKNITID